MTEKLYDPQKSVKISISRPISEMDVNRKYSIILNGNKVCSLSEGKTLEFSIEPGDYALSAKIDWCGSNIINFNAKPNEEYFFECLNNVPILQEPLYAVLYVTIYRKKYLLMKVLGEKKIYY
jgi:hypothetical protein